MSICDRQMHYLDVVLAAVAIPAQAITFLPPHFAHELIPELARVCVGMGGG